MTGERGQGSRRRLTIGVIAVVALLALVGAAWLAESLLTDPSDVAPVVVRQGDVIVAQFTVSELRGFSQHRVRDLGRVQEGPRVLDVLAAAGIKDFNTLTVTGLGVRDSGTITLQAAEVTDETLLDFANRGTVKVVGPGIEWSDRVRDVTVLVVE